MSNDVKLTVGVCVIVVAIFGSAGLVSHVMIELAGVVRADLQALRESMEAIACGELARNDDAVAGIESSNRPRQWPTADRPTAIAHPPVDASPNGHRYDGTIAVSIPRWPERCWRYRAENHPGRRARGFEDRWAVAGEALRDRLRLGFDVLVHCRGGLGRGE